MSTLLDMLVQCFRESANYQPLTETAPAAIFWPDGEREWESLVPRLRQNIPVLTLGPYSPADHTGPAIWIKCMLSRSLPDKLPPVVVPLVYLPGVSAEQLENADQRPREVELLVDVLYRSTVWKGDSGGDCKVREYLCAEKYGLKIEVRLDTFTEKAMLRALPAVADLTVEQLHDEEPWKAKDFEGLINTNIDALIAMGESANLEFKSTARCSYPDGALMPALEKVILKTMAGFLNSHKGGTLLIGVTDRREVCGIENDYPAFSRPEFHNPDGYERWLVDLLRNNLGPNVISSIHITMHNTPAGTVCKLIAEPSPKPILYKPDRSAEEIFYVRAGNATTSLSVGGLVRYYETRWC